MDTPGIRVKRWFTSAFGLVALAFCLRLLVMLLTSGLEYDITSYHIQAQSIFSHQNIYLVTNRYPYPPVWIWWTALAQWLSASAPLHFDWIIKVPALLGDCLIVALLRRQHSAGAGARATNGSDDGCSRRGRTRRGQAPAAAGAALFYAVNPVAILVTAGQGQFDGLVISLVVLAWACWRSQQPRWPYWAALALGGAIALKGYPILLLPALLAKMANNRQRWLAAALSLAPLLLAIVIYSAFFGLEGAMISRVLLYNSPLNFGWALYVPFLMNAFWPTGFPVVMLALAVMARAAILLLACRLPFRRPEWSLAYGWAVILLSLYVLAPGISAQYLLWVLPFLALIDLPWGWRYGLCSAFVMWIFYVAVYPGAVPWGAALRSVQRPFWFPCFVAVNLLWWLCCLVLWRRLLRPGKTAPPGEETARQPAADHARATSAT